MISLIKKLNDILPSSDKWKLGVLFILMLIAAGFEVLGIGMILAFVSIVSDPERLTSIEWLEPVMNYFGINEAQDLLVYGSIALIVVFVLKNAYLIAFHFIQARFLHHRFQSIATRLFKSYMNAPYVFHLDRNTARLIRNVTEETKILINYVMKPIIMIGMETVMITVIIILLLTVEPVITLVILVLLGGAGSFFLKFLKNSTRKFGKKSLKSRGAMIQEVNEGLGGFKDLTVMNRQIWFINRFKSSVKKFVTAEIFRNVSKQSSQPVVETIAVSGMLLIALMLVLQGRSVTDALPILTLFGVSALRLLPALSKLIGEYNSLRYNSYSINPIHKDLMKLESKDADSNLNDIKKLHLKDKIELDNISYSYPSSSDLALNNVSLTINKGTAVGFVGSSGAGKTTIADLILGLLDPSKGSVKIDGVDIKDNMKGWQKNIGYIPQFIYLSDSTIRSNIAFGLSEEEIDEKKLLKAVKVAQLEELVDSLPKGLGTIVGERGVKLSGGQRQRIGIARAFYDNPEVLVMDEATSALDNKTERYVIEAIDRLRKDRTVIIIAHRLTTVKNCDVLHVVKQGKIVASGTYQELLKNSEEFKLLVDNVEV